MGRKSAYGHVEKAGMAAVKHSKMGVRHGQHKKNLGPSRVARGTNAGVATGPIKGMDRGTG